MSQHRAKLVGATGEAFDLGKRVGQRSEVQHFDPLDRQLCESLAVDILAAHTRRPYSAAGDDCLEVRLGLQPACRGILGSAQRWSHEFRRKVEVDSLNITLRRASSGV
eukprot:7352240-Prymnesium_polylepis.1